ncbi:phytanoyl-CoA dioxygenase family protein [Sphingosinicella sp. CPCC 101087]|uniref:phytanoyl-CoA dioxygenase family protein n=1 Tax=Sphingosinicella sp. CPCC 101087 TaxID=2497754 RepID=UPI003529E617
MVDGRPLLFETDGAQLFEGALRPCIGELEAALSGLPADGAGLRLHGIRALDPLLARQGCIGAVAASVLGPRARPVRAILFNKTAQTNWSLAWHQDRTICVKARRDAPGFGPWTVKRGLDHVAPPSDLLARMVTLRAHLDDVPATNAPLLIAPGSHAYGRIAEGEVDDVARRCGTGSIRRRSSTHRKRPRDRAAGAFSRWTSPLRIYPMDWSGWEFEAYLLPPRQSARPFRF